MANERDDLPPVAASIFHLEREFAGHRQHLPERICTCQEFLSIAAHGGRPKRRLRQGRQAVPRYRMQHRGAAGNVGECNGSIRHRQSIADDQHRVLRRQVLRQVPGVLPIRGMAADGRGPRQQRRRRVPECQDHAVRGDRGAIQELRRERLTPRVPGDLPDLIVDANEPGVAGRRPLRLQEHVLQVVAIQRAQQKILAVGVRQTALRKAQELRRVARIRGQPRRRHIEQIGIIANGIRHAAPQFRSALYEHDVGRLGRRAAQQVGGQHGAAKPPAHD
jgi:hypothetical protein